MFTAVGLEDIKIGSVGGGGQLSRRKVHCGFLPAIFSVQSAENPKRVAGQAGRKAPARGQKVSRLFVAVNEAVLFKNRIQIVVQCQPNHGCRTHFHVAEDVGEFVGQNRAHDGQRQAVGEEAWVVGNDVLAVTAAALDAGGGRFGREIIGFIRRLRAKPD